jgi:enoyl-CoA hydratase/carnithine racemase
MHFETIAYETDGPLAWIRLNRPQQQNAINEQMADELLQASSQAQGDADIRVILLSGQGEGFSTGFDFELEDLSGLDEDDATQALKNELKHAFKLTMHFWDSPKPTIAAVHGYCLAGALDLALACDLTLAAAGCRFGKPEVRSGGGSVTMLLPFICGGKRAREILLTGNDRISAEQAESWGLVNRVVEPGDLVSQARELGLEIAGNDPHAVRVTKQAINATYKFGKMRNALKHALDLDFAIERNKRI